MVLQVIVREIVIIGGLLIIGKWMKIIVGALKHLFLVFVQTQFPIKPSISGHGFLGFGQIFD